MDNEEKYKKLIRAIKILRDMKPHDECLENWIKENAPEIAESEDENVRKGIIDYVTLYKDSLAEDEYKSWIAWLVKQGQPRMQYGIIINGVEYELIEDDEADECERCALKDQCSTIGDDVLCNTIFRSGLVVSHRFEMRK